MKKINYRESVNTAIINLGEKKSAYIVVPGETVHPWKENYTVRLPDEILVDSMDSTDKLILVFTARCVAVNSRLVYTLLIDNGIETDRHLLNNRLHRLARRGILNCTELCRQDLVKNNLQIYTVGTRGVAFLRSKGFSFYNLRLPSERTPEKLKTLIVSAQTSYALAETHNDIINGLTVVLKKDDKVFNNVRLYTAFRDNTNYIIEPLRRNEISFSDLEQKLVRINMALDEKYKEFREKDRFFLKDNENKIVIVCEDVSHIFEICDKLTVPVTLKDFIYFTYDLSTISDEVDLYKFKLKASYPASQNISIETVVRPNIINSFFGGLMKKKRA